MPELPEVETTIKGLKPIIGTFINNINHNIYFDEYEKLKRIVELIQIGRSS